jgi:uncharacterized repeat protein (TIGR01451 family)
MRKAITNATLAAFVLCAATVANAQNTAQGRATGMTLDIGGTSVITQSDTGTHNAPNPANTPNSNGFDATAAGSTVPAAPLIEAVTGPSRTRGCASPSGCPELFATPSAVDPLDPSLSNEVFVHSRAGDATVALLPGAAPGGTDVLNGVSSGSNVTVRCNDQTGLAEAQGDSEVNALVVGGNPVPIPGSVPPNTTIGSSQASLIVLNEQSCSTTTTSATCTVTALHSQTVMQSQVTDLKLSRSSGTITFDPQICSCGPLLTNSQKRSQVQTANGTPKNPPPDVGDRIRYTVDLINSGCNTAQGVVVIDRIPRGTTFLAGSVTVAGTPMPNITTANCPNVAFPGCDPAGADTSRQCLTIPAGNIPVSTTPTQVGFTVTVDSGSTGGNNPGCNPQGVGQGICNTALIQIPGATVVTVPRSNSLPCPNGTPTPSGTQTPGGGTPTPGGGGTPSGTRSPTVVGTGTPSGTPPETDRLITTGGGGCSLGGDGGGSAQMLPLLGVGLLLGIRQWRRRAARAKS